MSRAVSRSIWRGIGWVFDRLSMLAASIAVFSYKQASGPYRTSKVFFRRSKLAYRASKETLKKAKADWRRAKTPPVEPPPMQPPFSGP